ncbi:hypothetical protein CMT56_15085 [Elizabethkingia anophelis]|nr:hypothetical protein [Elizabethkingia anophelis]MDV3861085.1 hypothetical protein [Elizabethkingia anophelis]MDV3909508.1 hypothetical protein [Elizabethkingia anophelis]MDV3924298.1 hypothetical protein [Elizabethkingia anophelis]MDV3989339.1 hypothetical protein [Elizabethkingia anophelis]
MYLEECLSSSVEYPKYFGLWVKKKFLLSYSFPAAGYRNNTDGTLNNRGNNGNYWSSSEATSNANNLNFNSSSVNANNNNRTNGFSVRCVAVLDSRCLH